MTVWHWVRHGPTHARSMVGWRDVPADLSDTGQIDRLRAHLPGDALLVSSDLSRAFNTAKAIRGPAHIHLPPLPQLREMHFGQWDGLPFAEVSKRHPDLSRRFWEDPGDHAAPGGESWNTTSSRVQAAVLALNRRCQRQHIIAVAHFGVILTQLQRALGCDAYETLSHRIDNFAVTSLDWREGASSVVRINHLP